MCDIKHAMKSELTKSETLSLVTPDKIITKSELVKSEILSCNICQSSNPITRNMLSPVKHDKVKTKADLAKCNTLFPVTYEVIMKSDLTKTETLFPVTYDVKVTVKLKLIKDETLFFFL